MKKSQEHDEQKEPGGAASGAESGSAGTEPQREIPAQDRIVLELRTEKERVEAALQRSLADLSNLRKRHQKELEDSRKRVIEGLAQELLPVVDNFHLALAAHEQHEQTGAQRSEAHALVEGVKMVKVLLQSVLERHGVTEILSHGKTFDPTHHEAVGVSESREVEPGKVMQVLQRGYMLGERVIRPSRVLVSAPPKNDPAKSGADDAETPKK